MSEPEEIQKLLKQAFAPANSELRRDLWPQMARRLDADAPAVPWYDWALMAASAGALAIFPRILLLFAYHF